MFQLQYNESSEMRLILSHLVRLFFSEDKIDVKYLEDIFQDLQINENFLVEADSSGLIKKLLTEEVSFEPLQNRIIDGILNNPPLAKSLVEFYNHHKQTIVNLNNNYKSEIRFSIYFAVILEVLTHIMLNDNQFEERLVQEMFKTRHSKNYGSSFWNFYAIWKQTKDLFVSLKVISIDPNIFTMICWREFNTHPDQKNINEFIKKNHLSGLNAKVLKNKFNKVLKNDKHRNEVCGNILEAMVNEKIYNKHHKIMSLSNVKAGLALIYYLEHYYQTLSGFQFERRAFMCQNPVASNDFWHLLYGFKKEDNLIHVIKGLPSEWSNLYESWNIAFVIKKYLTKTYFYLPKLFIPATIACPAEFYISARLISLWLTVNFSAFSNFAKNEHFTVNTNSTALNFLLTQLGDNNLEYARKGLLKNNINLDKIYENCIAKHVNLYLYLKAIKMIKGDQLT